ncbi:hypothetical protein N9N67_11635 [Bacteriovoracaceae bacterium]|nr:hypothetical protein [Bacteriovoracaceae bacterium]
MTKKITTLFLMMALSSYVFAQKENQSLNCPIINGTFSQCHISDDLISITAELNCPAFRDYHYHNANEKLKLFIKEYGISALRTSEGLSSKDYPTEEDVIQYAQIRIADEKYLYCENENSLAEIKSALMLSYENKIVRGEYNLSLSSKQIGSNFIYTFNRNEQIEEVVWVNFDDSQNVSLDNRSYCSNQKLIIETDSFLEFNQFENKRITYQYEATTNRLLVNYQFTSHEEIINFNYQCVVGSGEDETLPRK